MLTFINGIALLAACTGAEDTEKATDDTTSPTTEDGTTEDGTTIAPDVVWYFGTSTGQTPDGSYVEDSQEILFIRTTDRETATITEEFWQENGRSFDHGLLVHDVDAQANTFTSEWATSDGTLRISGGFDAGDAWAWTAWHSVSVYADGAYLGWSITSTDVVDESGADTANKSIFDADNVETWRVLEVITPTDEASFEARLAEIEG